MLTLAFTACMMDGIHCTDHELRFTNVSMLQCVTGAEAELAKWQSQHPYLVITGYRCSVDGKERDA